MRKPPLAISDPSDAVPVVQKSVKCQRTSCNGKPTVNATSINSSSESKKKENVKISAASSQQQPLPPPREQPPHLLLRSKRSTRLSDRWPVLTRIIKGQKAQIKERKRITKGHNDTSDSSSDEDDDVITIGKCSKYPKYRQRVSHPTSPKYPSPLCGFLPVERKSVQRHLYADRGYSRASLHNRREFWRRRLRDWEEYQLELWRIGYREEEAYGGIEEEDKPPVKLPEHLARGPRRRCSSTTVRDSDKGAQEERSPSNPALFPRLGDLSGLRDSFLLSVDTWFDNFPLWSLSKLIWVFDLNSRTRHVGASESLKDENDDSKVNDGSNTSEDTLVPSFSEGDDSAIPTASGTSLSDFEKDYYDAIRPPPSRGETERPDNTHHQAILVGLPSNGDISSKTASLGQSGAAKDDADDLLAIKPWESCWFSRWEVIYHTISLAADLLPSMGAPEDLERKKREILRKIYTSPQNLYQPFAADDDATPQIDEQESVSCGAPLRSIPGKRAIPPVEEEDDYGEVIENPRYRLGATINPLSMFATSTSDARNTEVEIISTTEIRVDEKTGISICTL